MYSICSIAPTISTLLGIDPPADAGAGPIKEVIEASGRAGEGGIEKCLVFAPDAIGTRLLGKLPAISRRLTAVAPLRVDLLSVMPPKTPVCFASMFTGALPRVHGIREYVKKPPAAESVFEMAVRSGRKTAIVAVKDSSLDTIFRHTRADHFSEASDRAVLGRTVALVEAGDYDFIVAYQQEYDDLLHRMPPESSEALDAVRRHVDSLETIGRTLKSSWSANRYMLTFSPDHGAHFDPSLGTGNHGEDIPEDMEVTHFFGFG